MTRPGAWRAGGGLAAALLALLAFAGLPRGGGATVGREAHAEPWALVSSADGRTLYAASAPRRQVLVIDVARLGVVAAIEVGGTPRSLALSPDGAWLAVSLGPEDEVALVDVARRVVARRLPVRLAPEGVAFDGEGRRLFVAARLSGEVAVVDVASGLVTRRVAAGREPFALERSPDGRLVVAVSRRAELGPPEAVPESLVTVIDTATEAVRWHLPLPSCHLAEACAFTPAGLLLVPALRVRNLLPIVKVARGWVVSGVLAVVDPSAGEVAVLPLGEPFSGFADPSGVAVMPDGRTAFVASGGGNTLAEIDVLALVAARGEGQKGLPERLSLTSTYVRRRVPTPANPRGVAAAFDGTSWLAVAGARLADALLFVAPQAAARTAWIDAHLREDALRRGERAFYDATFCFQDAFSCASCHPEAHGDGLVYDFEIDGVGVHPVLNRSLLGLRGTEPLKWTGTNADVERQCGARFAMVLTRAEPFPPDLLKDLAEWIRSLPPPRPLVDARGADEATRERIARGRALFERSHRRDGARLRPSQRCITCHPPPHFTNRQSTDVGTRTSRDPTGRFDTPHLTGIGQKAPYLHDGRAPTLEAIWTAPGVGDAHGTVSDLSPADLADLVLYLQSL